MTKKHFIELADRIREYNLTHVERFSLNQIEELANFCESQNPRFNRQLWLDYIEGKCGPNGGRLK